MKTLDEVTCFCTRNHISKNSIKSLSLICKEEHINVRGKYTVIEIFNVNGDQIKMSKKPYQVVITKNYNGSKYIKHTLTSNSFGILKSILVTDDRTL